MRVFYFLFFVLFFCASQSFAQIKPGLIHPNVSGQSSDEDPGPDLTNLRADIIPHSPEAEALGKYGLLPMTLYSGMVNISVPIFEIKTPGFTLPFSLSYGYNGYKAMDVPSWAGLGWSVQGIGSITRIVKGQVDEAMASSGRYDNYIDPTYISWSQPFLVNIFTQVADPEPDIYVFNVGGYSGKFILIKGKAYIFPYQNIRIEPYSFGFRLTDDKGNVYTLVDYETTYHKATSSAAIVPTHKSAWYLSNVVSADSRDTVTFTYTPYTYVQPTVFMDSYSINSNLGTGLNTSGHTMTQTIFDGDHIDGLLPSSVSSKYGDIFFTGSAADRLDMIGSTGGKSLNSITVTSPDGAYNKQINLNHSYFGSGYNMRLNLQSLGIYQSFPTTDSTNYYFQYAGASLPLPANSDRSLDFWGYYNGANNSMLFPVGTFTPALYPYADRSSHMAYSQIGMLTQITYPTGGTSVLQYEQNQSGHGVSTNSDVAFAATKTVGDTLHISGGVTTGRSGFFGISFPQWVKVVENNQNDNSIPANVSAVQILDQYNVARYSSPLGQEAYSDSVLLPAGTYSVMVQCPYGSSPVTASATYIIRTNTMTGLSDAPGLRIKQITSYDNPSNGGLPLFTKQYTYNDGVQLLMEGITGANLAASCASYNIATYQSGVKSALSDLATEQFYYQTVSETTQNPQQSGRTDYSFGTQNTVMEVIQLSKTDYQYLNNNYLPLKSSSSSYQTFEKMNFNAFKVVKTTVIGTLCNGCTGCSELASPDITQPADLLEIKAIFEPYSLDSKYTLLMQQSDIDYDNSGNPAKQNTTTYYYDNPNHLFPTRTKTLDSKGQTVTTYLKYPLDYFFSTWNTQVNIDTTFRNNRLAAGNSTTNCWYAEQTALQPYQPWHNNTPGDQASFASVASGYNCLNTLQAAASTAVNTRDTSYTNYVNNFTAAIGKTTTPWNQGVLWMEASNMVSPVIEKYVTIKKSDSNEYLISATRNEYNIFTNSAGVQAAMTAKISQAELNSSVLLSSFTANPDSYYKPQVFFSYDNRLNLSVQNKIYGKRQSYLWDYRNAYPVAQVINSDTGAIAYTSFEADNTGNWNIPAASMNDVTAITGRRSYAMTTSTPLSKAGLNASQTYFVSYWTKNGSAFTIAGTVSGYPLLIRSCNGWKCYEHKVTGQTTITISGTGQIDEVRLYPAGALMTTYTYIPTMGMTTTCDENNRIMYYVYDGIGRLKVIKDQDGNVIKTIDYHYELGH